MPVDEYEPGVALGDQAHQHDTRSVFGDAVLDVALGLAKRWAVEASLPVRGTWQQTTFTGANGQDLGNFESIHHSDGLLSGVGDVSTMARWRAIQADPQRPLRLDLRAGLTLPTGGIEPNPETLGRAGEEHQHAFFGSGTLDPQVGFDGSWEGGSWRVLGFGQARASLYDNRTGYRQGARGIVGLGGDFSAGLMSWRFLVQPELYREDVSGWGNDVAENSGRTDVLLGLGATWLPAERWFVQLRVKAPIHTWSEHGHLTTPWYGLVSIGHAVALWP